MKLNYLFKSPHNGHFNSYELITSNTVLTKEKVIDWLSEFPGVGRTGAGIASFLDVLGKNGIEWDKFICPCCGAEVVSVLENNLIDFIEKCEFFGYSFIHLEGISGNY